MVVQKYLHDLDAWHSLSTEQQERVIGRRKADNVEGPDDDAEQLSHRGLATVVDEEEPSTTSSATTCPSAGPAGASSARTSSVSPPTSR
ncbi:Dyp-type peroxidase [Rathayibacter oskolensis]|uniref:Dyp-type peroxidase domain-containing protein n=1 Tax=Rathayibacter oskolensis TaxID=1891671 RepID=UPI00265EC970|nr:Dyp-type peroxidase domain-containing protein [Rathayibacter oskolensis]WKK72310.1 Dyp-type peroxidase [Rathayibacter oskolensis]